MYICSWDKTFVMTYSYTFSLIIIRKPYIHKSYSSDLYERQTRERKRSATVRIAPCAYVEERETVGPSTSTTQLPVSTTVYTPESP